MHVNIKIGFLTKWHFFFQIEKVNIFYRKNIFQTRSFFLSLKKIRF